MTDLLKNIYCIRKAGMALVFYSLCLAGVVPFFPAEARILTLDLGGQCVPRHLMLSQTLINQSSQRFRTSPSRKATKAKNNLELTLNFLRREFNWRGPAGKNKTIYLYANLSERRRGRCIAYNASYGPLRNRNTRQLMAHMMTVLKGDPSSSLDIADDIDVLGHELGHGVYMSNPYNYYGAMVMRMMNEGYGDVLGITVRAWYESGQNLKNTVARRDSFILGRNIGMMQVRRGLKKLAMIRDAANPARTGGFDHYSVYRAFKSQGKRLPSPHPGAGMITLPYKLMVIGGQHPNPRRSRLQVSGLGFDKAFRIMFYIAQNRSRFSSYPGFATAARNAARNIYGYGSKEYITTDRAFAAVGLGIAGKQYPMTQPVPQTQRRRPPKTYPKPQVPDSPQPTTRTPTPKPTGPTGPTGPAPSPQRAKLSGPAIIGALLTLLGSMIYIGSILYRRRYQAVVQKNRGHVIYEAPGTGGRGQSQSGMGASQGQNLQGDNPQGAQARKPVLRGKKSGHNQAAGQLTRRTDTATSDQQMIRVEVNGQTFTLPLADVPVTIGRQGQGDPALTAYLALDDHMSRQHFDIWYRASDNQLYVYCHSANGLTLDGHSIHQGEKAKITFDKSIIVTAGRSRLTLIKHGG